ncbi:hypothetical protein BDV41DRAFT_517024 [Aspergillus transmontanensis]|uniref:Uncharacterized protein n=1 Tax=Aspergillus transmontanensis TaxID=1034304 RepID=A0A5N6WHD0_9EURO|nr:hypothetical protein BDV41DRAFT_517024 [Aspergillus transmontanensis]
MWSKYEPRSPKHWGKACRDYIQQDSYRSMQGTLWGLGQLLAVFLYIYTGMVIVV